jgi:hypothetical protein
VKGYAFKINILAGDLERGVLAPTMTMTTTMVASTALALALTPTVGLFQR